MEPKKNDYLTKEDDIELNWQAGNFKRGVFISSHSLVVKNLLPQGFPCQFTLWIIWFSVQPHNRDRRSTICAFSGAGLRRSAPFIFPSFYASQSLPQRSESWGDMPALPIFSQTRYISPSGSRIEDHLGLLLLNKGNKTRWSPCGP